MKHPERRYTTPYSIWGYPSWLVVFNAVIVSTGMVFGGVAAAINVGWWLAAIIWFATCLWFFYWATQ